MEIKQNATFSLYIFYLNTYIYLHKTKKNIFFFIPTLEQLK